MVDKTYHHGDLRMALLVAARGILERDGLGALTLRACARAAGVSHAAPLHHFRNLAELLAAVATSGFEDFVRELDDGSCHISDPLDRLIEMGIVYVRFAAVNPALYSVMFGADGPHVQSDALGLAMRAAWEQLYNATVAAGGETHALSNATLAWSVAHGHAMLVAARCMPPEVNPESTLRASLDIVANGMRAQRDLE